MGGGTCNEELGPRPAGGGETDTHTTPRPRPVGWSRRQVPSFFGHSLLTFPAAPTLGTEAPISSGLLTQVSFQLPKCFNLSDHNLSSQ